MRIFITTLMLFILSAQYLKSQIGEGYEYKDYNQNNAGGYTTISYYKDGYYNNYHLNLKDIVEKKWYGSTSYFSDGAEFWIDGEMVATWKKTHGDYYIRVTKSMNIRILQYEDRTGGNRRADCDVTIVIKPITIAWAVVPTLCQDDPKINLSDYIKGGVNSYFSGAGVTGTYFDPAVAGPGNHTITYTANDKTYTTTIRVSEKKNITSTLLNEYLNTSGKIDLASYFLPTGGTFSVIYNGSPIIVQSGRYLNPLDIIPLDDYTSIEKIASVTYTVVNGGCTTTHTTNLKIKSNNVEIKFLDILDQCESEGEIDLLDYVDPKNGIFSGSGITIEGNRFAKLNKTGTPSITYKVTQNGYTFSATKYVRIRELPTVEFGRVPDVCNNTPFDLSDYVEPKGGIFSGTGISGNIFNPEVAGMGTHTIKYTFRDANGCESSTTRDIIVKELNSTTIKFLDMPNTCLNAGEIYLPQYIQGFNSGTFSGRGVQGEYFNPSLAGAGNIQISYIYGGSSCKTTITKYIKVIALPIFTFNELPEICNEGEIVNLLDYVTIKTGTFSGTGVVDNKFHSSLAGIGNHTIEYSITADGCTTTSSKVISVKAQIPSNLAFKTIPDLCTQNSAIDLNEYVTHKGGVFSGRGVTGNYFNPSVAGANQHQIIYTYTENTCSKKITTIITVSSETAVSFYNIAPVCTKDVIVLNNYVSHIGGTFSGPGVLDNKFYPEQASIGNHVITYTYTNSLGCETIITKTINVSMLMDNNITFTSIDNKCVASASVFLRDYINVTDGTFSGRGVTGEYFNPASAGIGTWTVTWSKSNGSCNQTRTTTITVLGEPNILWSNIPTICDANTVVDLGAYVNKLGGTFSGPGVVDGKFYSDQAGMGTHTVIYTYREGDCEVSKTNIIQVNGLLPGNLQFNKIANVCVSGDIIDLEKYVNIPGGEFKGKGVTLTQFSPLQAGAGLHEISYTVKDGLCSKTVKQSINVISSNIITFTNIPIVCNSASIDLVKYVEPKGGVFSGVGVQDNKFDPSIAGIGSHTIFYTYTNEAGCQTIVNKIVSVDQLIPETSWKPIEAVCGSSSPIYLPSYIVGAQGGTFSGTGVTGEYFDPSKVISGIYTVTYTLSNGRCKEQFTTTIQVKQVSPLTFNDVPNICYANTINLYEYVTPTGGRFEGKGIENNYIFNPATAGRGNHTITYYYQNSNGCESIVTKTINVIDLLDNIQFKALPPSCIEGTQINLRDYVVGSSSGSFSGKGVSGDIFSPKMAGEGLHTIKFTINNGGCLVELSQNIEVYPSSNLQWYKINNICYSTRLLLNRYVNISGGEFTGYGVEKEGTNYYFNPKTAGIGNHTITYTITDNNGCGISLATAIKVDNVIEENAYWEDLPRVCVSSSAVYLPDYIGSLGQGTFSGRGVAGKYFNPSVAGPGTHTISFTISQGTCVLTLETTITVDDINKIVFNTIPDICTTAPVNLNNYVSPQGGKFSGTGVDKNHPLIFDPSVSGIGEFTLTYEYTNEAGCQSTATKIIKVVNLLPDDVIFDLDKEDTYCITETSVNLRKYVNSVEGSFKGAGVTGDFFSPVQAGAGIHKILFYIEKDGCKMERYDYISVDKGETVIFSNPGNICYVDRIDLSQLVSPKGGEFSGMGVSGNYFYPDRAGKGTHAISYAYSNIRGCKTYATQNLVVTSLNNAGINFVKLPNVCDNSNPVRLTEYVQNLNIDAMGIFSGRGVDGEYFNPSIAGKGTHTISLNVGEGVCRKTFIQTITVTGASNLVFNDLPTVCSTKKLNLNDYATQAGTFSGPGVVSNTFDPVVAGIGEHIITFTYSNNIGCEFITQKTISVVNLLPEAIKFNDLGSYCQNQPGIDLSSFINVDKSIVEFKGTGVDGYYFNPANVNPGTYTITAIIGQGVCKTSLTKTVRVNGSETVIMSDVPDICTSGNIDLANYVSHKGGVFVNPNVEGTIFKTTSAGIGKHVVSYIYNTSGCETVIQKTINVVELLPSVIEFNVIPDVCADGSPIKLTQYTNTNIGKFTGTGVQGEYFNPSVAGSGAWTITYSVGNTKTCKKDYTQVIIVHPKDNIIFNDVPTVCTNEIIDLNNYVSHRGGTFTGPGVVENKFHIAVAGAGNHLVTYNYTGHNGCKASISKTIFVPQIYPEIKFMPVAQMCQNGKTISLNEYVNIAGGRFTGIGVSGTVFDPKLAGGGNHTITYTLGSETCKKEVTQIITVVGIPQITFNNIPDVCFNERIRLSDYVNENGTFSGNGVAGEYFNPATAGVGTHKVIFNYSQDQCTVSIEKTINVLSINDVNIKFFPLPALCVSDQSIDLSEYTNSAGNFTGTGVTGNIFDPSIAGPGTHEINFSVGNSSCKREYKQYITVYANTVLKNTSEIVICNGQEIDLLSAVNISGGIFSGSNVTGTIFTPTKEGVFPVTYSYQNKNGCTSQIKFNVTVNGMHPENVTFNEVQPLCINSASINLKKYVSYQEGTFTGKGVQGELFNPSIAGAGIHEITYTIGSGNCTMTIKKKVIVNATTNLVLAIEDAFCKDMTIDLEKCVNVQGAKFSGPGIANNILKTASAGIGKHVLTCKYTDANGCETTVSKSFEIKALNPDGIVFKEIEDYCESDSRIDLRNYINVTSNVVFSGRGVEGFYFNPLIAKTGTHEITATIGLNNACKDQYKQIVNVLALPTVEFNEIPSVCFVSNINLMDFVNNKDGEFSGKGVDGNLFYPEIAGIGTHQVIYAVENSQGCRTEVKKTIEVKSLFPDNIEFKAIGNMCVNSEPVYLNKFVNYLAGTFSGNGVSNMSFNPAKAGIGTHQIVYSVGSGSCKKDFTQYVNVLPVTNITFSALPVICQDQEINLNGYVNIASGTFQGAGIEGSTLNTRDLEIGNYTITYLYKDDNGCSSQASQVLSIKGKDLGSGNVWFKEIASLCVSGAAVNLENYVSHTGGTFKGAGVTGKMFNPANAGIGVHLLTYTIGNGECQVILTKEVIVNATTNLLLTVDDVYCKDLTIDLGKCVNVQGAVFSGPGIENNILKTTSAGIGKHILTCKYVDSNNCETSISKAFEVKALNPSGIIFKQIEDYCESASRIDLRNYINATSNVVFSGRGVEGFYFNPSIAKTGTHEIVATIGLDNACKDQYKQYVNVLALPIVEFNEIPPVCFVSNINLMDFVSNKYGIFSGKGVDGNIFNPEIAGIGTHQVIYAVENSQGCRTEVKKTIEVKSLFPDNIEFKAIGNMCVNSEPVYLNKFVNYLAGTFSGNGVSNMSFNPAKAGIGTHQIVYSVGSGSCKKDFTQYVTVLPAINITFNALPVICQDQEINLNGYVNIPSGTFQGAGIEGTILNTKDLEIGNYTIIYSYKDDNGCSSQASQILVIKSKDLIGSNIIFNNIEDICVSSSPINLDLYVTQKGGAFTGNGVTGKMFDPLRAGAGVHLITYTIGNGECQVILTKEVIVKQSPTIVWHDLPTLCFENEQIELNNYVSLKGGRFSGIGVENGYLKRSLISKEGIYTITYEYDTDNGCTVSVNTQINIEKATPNNIEFANPGIVCLNSSRVNLYEFVNNDNGTFSGTGVAADGLFDPLVAGIGEHRITYSFGAGKCQKQLYQYISVSASKDVTFSNPGKKCDSTPIDLTQYVNYKGGVFTGKGVEGNLFDPKISGEGIHLVSYLYKEDNCVVKVSQNIEVLNTKELIINVDRSAVESSALVRFWSEGFEISNYKWDFGDGGYSLEKEPFHYYYHTGSFDLTLICNDQNGCKHTIKKEKFITVNDYLKSERSIIEVNDPLAKVGVHYEDFPKNEYKGYPNPFTNQITIQLAGNESGVIVVYDLTGSVVHTSQFLNGEIEKTINTQNLAPGMYLVKVGNKTFKMNKK